MKTFDVKKQKTYRFLCYFLMGFVIFFYTWLGILLFLLGCKPIREAPAADCNEALTTGVAEKVLRLHIIADSNTEADQQVKYRIRDAVISYIKPYLVNVRTKEEAIKVLNEHLPDFVELSNQLLEAENFAYRAQAAIGTGYFPIKQYGDLILPAGEYDALKITLGTAGGKNWWCIVFPQLCFVDTVAGKLPDSTHEQMKEYLSKEEYAMMFPEKTTRPVMQKSTPKIRFWFWERVIKKWGK